MARLATRQYVPIFVGSTFVDMKLYRDAVLAALTRLEAIVRGMEYFGSKPGSPIEECLAAVRSCRLYIGIFGMRYGSIPDGYDRSMVHLEYDEAQKQSMPSLIYLIDEERQPVLPIHVETGDSAAKLKLLKNELRRKHLVSFFTTEDDLAAKILADVPPALEQIGTEILGTISPTSEAVDAMTALKRFSRLPKRFAGSELIVTFTLTRAFESPWDGSDVALGLEIGDTVTGEYELDAKTGARYDIYAQGAIAEQVLDLPVGSSVTARVITAFGVTHEVEYDDKGTFRRSKPVTGLLIKEVISVSPSSKHAG